MPRVFDCREIAREHLRWVKGALRGLPFVPRLATVHFTPQGDPASLKYRQLISRDAAALGIPCDDHEVAGPARLESVIESLNGDPDTTGVVVLYPLGIARRDDEVMDLVSPAKDIEGLHSTNLGYLIKYRRFLDEARGVKCVVPATAKAVVKTLLHPPGVPIEGAFAVIINNSMRVGKPLGLMLENLGATVVKCYDKTPPRVLRGCVRRADILVTAVPDPAFRVDPSWIKPGAAVLDVSFDGNIDHAALARGPAARITAPDNRIGQMTRAMMLVNLVYCAQGMAAARQPSR